MSIVRQSEYRDVTFYTVTDDESGQRIDNYLLSRLKGLPKSRLYRLLRKGEVRVNKGRIKPDYRLASDDLIRVPPLSLPAGGVRHRLSGLPPSLASQLEKSVLLDDANWLVVNKPAGLAVHGGSGQSWGLIEALRLMREDCRYLELCHRIDRDTSGCLVVAKKRSALRRFHAALRERKLNKRYLALVVGRWVQANNTISAPLKKNVLQSGERMVEASAEGKPSKTLFDIRKTFAQYTLVEAQPVTGRTHQIRVHAKVAGCPIVGDRKYGIDDHNRLFKQQGFNQMFLHAQSIALPGELNELALECPIPNYWTRCFETLI